ncbi:Pectinesterase inhibitor [Melia azedarach]|uniref:Pectinesterase inhibitor n=1 Tax=Melia azedarach TaxID=155640 RepID=A0ACC1YEV7_MELAZ|nr:Pectinesterase inhibitor [Melia azedarach]
MKSFIFVLSIFLLLFQESPTKCSASFWRKKNETKPNLIQKTCKQTHYYDLCILSLESDPRSSNADIKELALISAELVLLKANETLWHVGKLFRKVKDPVLYRLYGTCIEEYRAIVERQVPEAIAALRSGQYSTSKTDAAAAATHAQNCQEQFGGETRPFSHQNRAVHDLSLVTSTIIDILLG